ncbi:restriction endonuclease subunit S [uncultured Prevotella sp.]|uniref:restriction endonuclease subunit S n=1 Tax=uncultured Prevotella sp. TaxID=159272 RepID=UPI00263771E8|nr:restriction endonuclease subunit S [uncultured Prevotella sp.]
MKLNDIAEFVTDKISSSNISLDSYVTTDSLLQNKRGREGALNLPPVPCALTHYRQGDVLVANIRPYLKKVWYADSEGGCSSDVLVFRAKNGHCTSFLYTVLMQDSFFEYAMLGSKGSKMPRGDKDQIMRYELPTFTPMEEENIGNMMVDIMSKIKVNHQINDNLEAMAKQLYDYWFVQFDFPNEEGKPYKSSGGAMVWNEKLKREIPTSFDVKSLSEIIEVKDGTHDSPKPQDNGYFLLTSKHLTERGLDYASAYKISKEDYESINKRSKVDTNDILFSMIGTIGNSYFVEETKINFAIKNMALFKTSAKRWFSEYMYLYLSSCDYKHYEGNSLSGSIQKFVSLRTLRDMPILYHEDIIKVFAKEVRNIITMMVNLRKENIELTKQRDELLPLLMNGQASVNSD